MALLRQWDESYERENHSQQSEHRRRFQNIIKNSIYYKSLTITTLIHLRDQATYVWSTSDTIRTRSASSCRTIRRTAFSVGRSTFNPHLLCGFSFLRTREYRLPGVVVHEHQRITIRGVGRRVVTRRGSLIFLYVGDGLWRRLNLESSCSSVQEVES